MAQWLKRLIFKPKKIFLLDAVGALVSAFFLGVVLVRFEKLVGMPLNILYLLAIIPCFFAVYSIYCHFALKRNWSVFLRIIAVANLLYCILTMGLLFVYYQSLSVLGLLYFLVEQFLIGILIAIELKASSKNIVRKY